MLASSQHSKSPLSAFLDTSISSSRGSSFDGGQTSRDTSKASLPRRSFTSYEDPPLNQTPSQTDDDEIRPAMLFEDDTRHFMSDSSTTPGPSEPSSVRLRSDSERFKSNSGHRDQKSLLGSRVSSFSRLYERAHERLSRKRSGNGADSSSDGSSVFGGGPRSESLPLRSTEEEARTELARLQMQLKAETAARTSGDEQVLALKNALRNSKLKVDSQKVTIGELNKEVENVMLALAPVEEILTLAENTFAKKEKTLKRIIAVQQKQLTGSTGIPADRELDDGSEVTAGLFDSVQERRDQRERMRRYEADRLRVL